MSSMFYINTYASIISASFSKFLLPPQYGGFLSGPMAYRP